MTVQEAIKILNPETSSEALLEIEYYGGFNGKMAQIQAIIDASVIAVECMEKQIPKKPKQSGVTDGNGVFHKINGIEGVPYDLCPNCETNLCTDGRLGRKKEGFNYCMNCGQALKWGEEE